MRPILLAVLALAACGGEPEPLPGQNFPPPGALLPVPGLETARGAFEGRGGAAAAGTVSVVRSDGRWVLALGDDFRFDGPAGVQVAFGEDGPKAPLGTLAADEGASAYEVVPPLDVGDYTEVWLLGPGGAPAGFAKLSLL